MSVATSGNVSAVVAAMAILAAVHPVSATPRHHRAVARQVAPVTERRSAATVGPTLPQWERDGVPGNDAFNNQLRKFSDPLGAHGGR